MYFVLLFYIIVNLLIRITYFAISAATGFKYAFTENTTGILPARNVNLSILPYVKLFIEELMPLTP